MSSQIKIFKQDVINFLTQNLNEKNIDDYITELKNYTNLSFNNEIIEKGYKFYQSEIIIESDLKMKFQGFGRCEFEALFTSLKNFIEYLLQDEKFLEEVRGSMKMFIKLNKDIHKKENIFENNISNNYKSFTLNYNLLPDPLINKGLHTKTNGENYFSEELKVHNKGLALNNNTDFNLALTSKDLSKLKPPIEELKEQNEVIVLKKDLEEKTLIILEMEKLILDIMNYNKKIIEYLDVDSNSEAYPNYFKCPISWEKMENPVITNEGHSYEKWAIEKWLNNQNTSPVTGLVLTDRSLTNNYNLKSSIDDFHKKQNRIKKLKIEFQKFITKSEYDLNDLKKYFHTNQNK